MLKKEKDENYIKALDYLNKLDELKEKVDKCKKGNKEGCNFLAGINIKSKELHEKLCSLNSGKACNRLAFSFTKDNTKEELELYKKSCNLNFPFFKLRLKNKKSMWSLKCNAFDDWSGKKQLLIPFAHSSIFSGTYPFKKMKSYRF